MSCIILIACLIVGFILGRMGSRIYDGEIIMAQNMEDFKIIFTLTDEEVSRCRSLLLKVNQKR